VDARGAVTTEHVPAGEAEQPASLLQKDTAAAAADVVKEAGDGIIDSFIGISIITR
jgi:hypothetical protein